MIAEKYECDCGYVDFRIGQTPVIQGRDMEDKVRGFIGGLEFMDHEVTVNYHDFVCEECQKNKSPLKKAGIILGVVEGLVGNLFYYGRKDDEDLKPGEIEEQVKAGVISVADILDRFREKVIDHFIEWNDPESINWFVPRNMAVRKDLPGNEKNRPDWSFLVRFELLAMEISDLIYLSEKLKTEYTFEVDLENADKWRTRLLALKKISRILKSECGAEVKRPGFVDDLRQAIKNRKGE